MITSETLTKLLPALLAAKKQFKPAIKNALNPHFNRKYVDLNSVVDATEEALQANDLILIQPPDTALISEERMVAVTSRLFHSSGEWIEATFSITAGTDRRYDAQTVGSAITYARRYSYMGILGIAPEDDDGNVASAQAGKFSADAPPRVGMSKPNGKPAPTSKEYAAAQQKREAWRQAPYPGPGYNDEPNDGSYDISDYTDDPGPTITEAQAKRWFAICKASGKTEEEMKGALQSIGIQRSKEIPKSQYDTFIEWAGGQNEARA